MTGGPGSGLPVAPDMEARLARIEEQLTRLASATQPAAAAPRSSRKT
jgi:hypothetical protein